MMSSKLLDADDDSSSLENRKEKVMAKSADKMNEIFTSVQYNRTCHPKFLKKLKEYYDKIDFERFLDRFIANLRIPMTYLEKHPHVENVFLFAVKFLFTCQPEVENEEEQDYELNPLLEATIDFLLESHNCNTIAVRFRTCYFLNKILQSMPDDVNIDSDLCTKILQCMIERIVDKSPKVRAQAAIALRRLQEPSDDKCPVMNVYLFHLARDPSPEVRKAIIANMARHKLTLHAAISRTRDVDESVRKQAYLFISKISVKSLTISQREQIISKGLQDKSDMVKKCVIEILIPSWLRYYNNSYVKFIKAIDVENATESISLALENLFKNEDIITLKEQLPIDDTKCIPLERLNSEVVMFWRCFINFLKTEDFTDEFEQIMPELSVFCTYVSDFVNLIKENSNNQYDQINNQFILIQLFEMVKLYDLADEMGRKNLKELILDILQTYQCLEKTSECIVKFFEKVVPDEPTRTLLLVEAVNEIRMPTKSNVVATPINPIPEDERQKRRMKKAKLCFKLLELEDKEYSAVQNKDYAKADEMKYLIDNLRKEIKELDLPVVSTVTESQTACEERKDPETISQCLQIMYYMMLSRAVTKLSPTLRTLMESIVLPNINFETTCNKVFILALRCLGLCCHVDKDLAKKYFMINFLYISKSDNENVWIVNTEIIFDLLLKYGFKHFEITEGNLNVNDKNSNSTDISNNSIVKALIALLDSEVNNLQTVAAEGFCKLILHKRISSHQLISQLLILWHNPTTKTNPVLSQCLSQFFNLYIGKVPESQNILEEAYLPTMKMLANAPDTSPLLEIDALRVSNVIINFTCSTIHNSYSVHNRLAYTILTEILNVDTDIGYDVLIKSLKALDVQLDEESLKNDILKALDDVEKLLNESREKRLLSYIHQFKTRITALQPQPNQENPDNLEDEEDDNILQISDTANQEH